MCERRIWMENAVEEHVISKGKTKVFHYHRDCILGDIIFEHLHRKANG